MSDLFSWSEGAALRDRGMAIAAAAQARKAPGWSDRAYAAIVRRARAHPTVHRDDVALDFTEEPAHPNAAGSVWGRAIRDGVLEETGRTRKTTDPKKHRHSYPVWRSLLYAAPAREAAE